MTSVTPLSLEQFQEQYAQSERAYEFWFGEAIPKAMPTWIHALLQIIIGRLLDDRGFISGAELELRIVADAHPKPDVAAVRTLAPEESYPTKGVDVIVEILSPDDKIQYLREKCSKYQEWGCSLIYVVDPADRSISLWQDGSLLVTRELAGIPVQRIWEELDIRYSRAR